MMSEGNRDKIKLYRKRQAGTMAYETIEEHMVYCAGGSLVGGVLVFPGDFVVLDDFGRSERVLSPESFHKIYELEEDADCSET